MPKGVYDRTVAPSQRSLPRYEELILELGDEDNGLDYLVRKEIIVLPETCECCGKDDTYRKHVVRGLYNIRLLRCRMRECRHSYSIFKGTFFEDIRRMTKNKG